jgi:glycerol-3-phosphate O-acyltransferase
MGKKRTDSDHFLSGPPGSRVLYLVDAANDQEAKMLRRWLRDQVGDDADMVRITSSRRGKGGDIEGLAQRIASELDTFLIPVRVVWLAAEKKGKRSVSWFDALPLGDPRDPRGLRARWTRTMRPGRIRFVASKGASLSDLRNDYESSGQLDPITSFVIRRAWLVLDQAERRLRGNRYKVPRFLPEAILARAEFVDAINAVALNQGITSQVALEKAEGYLREMAATHSPYTIDLIANGIEKLYSQGYSEIRYDEKDVRKISDLAGQAVVFLPSHRSNLDRLSLQFMLWENDLPPNHTAGGVNMNFFPVGPLMRRTGVFFIRRSFRDNELYKTVLHAYLDYLVEKRFPLEWYLEGGRSRSGKLLPPRLGLLSYVVDSYRRGKTDEIQLVPVSIAYDQIQDVPSYAREAKGEGKEKESIGWLVSAVRSLRRRYGNIYIRFGEPLAVSSIIGTIESEDEKSIGLQKLGFEVMYRIGQATPVTPTALVSIALLAARGSARSTEQLSEDCADLVGFIRSRDIPVTEDFEPEAERVGAVLAWLDENDDASSHEALGRTVHWLDDDQTIRISYYRNVVVHYFVPRAIAEVALRAAIAGGSRDPSVVRESMLALRDLLKFEFFFPEKDPFLANADRDIEIDVPAWEQTMASQGAEAVLTGLGSPKANWAILPFLDAYQVVGDELEAMHGAFEEKPFLKSCLDRARMYRIEQKVISAESASQVLFASALALARNRDLLEPGQDLLARRARFAAEVRAARQLAATGR